MYILDEPSIGLHQRDNTRLLNTLFHLRDLGNTVIVVEHDEEAIVSADHIIDIGPGQEFTSGEIVAEGPLSAIKKSAASLTGKYLSGKETIAIPAQRVQRDNKKLLTLSGATGNNLQGVTLCLPIGLFTYVTGVSGSGKSTLINNTLYPITATRLNKASTLNPPPMKTLKVCSIWTKLSTLIRVRSVAHRDLTRRPIPAFLPRCGSCLPAQEARSRGYKPGRFSFNIKGGRCEVSG